VPAISFRVLALSVNIIYANVAQYVTIQYRFHRPIHLCVCMRVCVTLESGADVGRENSVGNNVGSDLAETRPPVPPAPVLDWLRRPVIALVFRLQTDTDRHRQTHRQIHTDRQTDRHRQIDTD